MASEEPELDGNSTGEDVLQLSAKVENNTQELNLLKEMIIGFQKENSRNLGRILESLDITNENEESSTKKKVAETKSSEPEEAAHAWKVALNLMEGSHHKQQNACQDEIERLKQNVEELEKELSEAQDENEELEKDRDECKHQKELLEQRLMETGQLEEVRDRSEFPSNDTVIHNLLIAQIEFYFSDHHLKRDKPLMQKLTAQPQGFIQIEDVMKFPKVRTLGQTQEVVEKSVLASRYLTVEKDNKGKVTHVGRSSFQPPRIQEFPFRRTVFVYGVHRDNANEQWIRNQFDCFGVIQKVKFDNGPHSTPRKVGVRLLQKEPSRITHLIIQNKHHTRLQFKQGNMEQVNLPQFRCHSCERLKTYKEGYYFSSDHQGPQTLYCIQCAARKAEENLKQYTSLNSQNGIEVGDMFGVDTEKDNFQFEEFHTCLIVYESQRQASKCVFVRSRLGIEGCFATHFHNYTRNKKEICQGIAIPPVMKREESTHRLVQVPKMKPQKSMGIIRHRSALAKPSMVRWRSTPVQLEEQNNRSIGRGRFDRF